MLLQHDPAAGAQLASRADLDHEVRRLRTALGDYLQDREAPGSGRHRIDLCGDWLFSIAGDHTSDDAVFATVVVPHYDDFDHGSYRRYLDGVDPGRVWLCFEAVDYEAWVRLDGVEIGHHKGYFAPFRFEITEHVRDGARHRLDVQVRRAVDRTDGWTHIMYAVNTGDAHGKGIGSVVNGRLMAGAGILGRVCIETTAASYLDDIYVHGEPRTATAQVQVTVRRDRPLTLRARVRPRNVASGCGIVEHAVDAAAGESAVTISVHVPEAQPWTPDTPALYLLALELLDGGTVIDSQAVCFGFREVTWAADGGVLLNGAPLFLRGTASVGDLWRAAWAGDADGVIDSLLRMKALFANVVRIHVHALPQLVYDCADRMGICLYQDAPLQWHCFAPAADVTVELAQVADMVRHLRNHPAVLFHTISNEIHMHSPLHAADRAYLEGADACIGTMPHGFLVVQDHNGPERPQSPVTTFHEYPGYFDRTARWQGLAPELPADRRSIMSEYGGGAITSWPAMRQTALAHAVGVPVAALPSEPDGPWTVEQLSDHPLGVMLCKAQRVVGRHGSWRAYHEATNAQQALVLAHRTGVYRRHRDRIAGVIQQFFQNPTAHLYNPWVDLALMDHLGEPTSGYYALREAFRPLALDLAMLARRAVPGQRVPFELWIYNDYAHVVAAASIAWEWVEAGTGAVHESGSVTLDDVPPDSSVCVLKREVTVPQADTGTTMTLRAELQLAAQRWCRRMHTVQVAAAPQALPADIAVLGDVAQAREKLDRYGCRLWPFTAETNPHTPVLVLPRLPLTGEQQQTLRDFAAAEGRVVLLERPDGEDLSWIRPDQPWRVLTAPMICDVVQPEASLAGEGLDLAALTDWNTGDGRVVEFPLLAGNSRKSPRWAVCGDGLQYSAIHEIPVNHGSVIACQMVLWRALEDEPSAWALLRYMLSRPPRTGMP